MTARKTTAQVRLEMYAKMTPRDAVVHALTAYDRKMANRKSHNPLFIGIALRALHELEEETPDAGFEEILGIYSGRLLGSLIKELGLADRYTVGRWGDLEAIAA